MRAGFLIGGVACLIGLAVTSAAAASVTVAFEGTVTSIVDEQGLLDGSVQEGSPLSGSFTYPSAGTDLNSEPGVGAYDFAAPPAAFRLEVGAYVFETSPAAPRLSVLVRDNSPQDLFSIRARSPLLVSGPLDPVLGDQLGQISAMSFSLGSPLPGPLSSDQLPPLTSLLTDWPNRVLRLEAATDGAPLPVLTIEGQVTTIVPEPSSLLLMTAGLLLLGRRRWLGRAR